MKTRPFFMTITVLLFFTGFNVLVSAQDKPQDCPAGPKIEVKNIAVQKTLVIKAEVPTSQVGPKMGELYGKLFAYMGQKQVSPSGPPFAVYYSFDPEGNTVFEAGVPVASSIETDGEVKYKEFEAMKVVSTMYVGPYENMMPVYETMQKYVKDYNLKDNGTSWEIYLTDPNAEKDPQKYQTIIWFPVK
ncbi:MAG: GyrI-like domain-containing protein [Bacteroidales bacterium]|nr:GyrI-like domain-containing protein [Bacteroidales bacterium]